ncbi:MAG: methionyl-tRNA formyltransferase [Gemmatimonadota bacterium]
MRFGWIGVHQEGRPALAGLLDAGAPLVAAITLKPELAAFRSGADDYRALCERSGLPLYQVANINDEPSLQLLRELALDVVFVIGWSQILKPATLQSARIGMIGAHASLLPHNRGSAPVNWALIKGEQMTGNSLMWLAEGVDAGDLIDQTAFCISPYDTCATLYDRVAESNRDMLLRVLPRLLAGERPGAAQRHTNEPVLPRRRPSDGLVDWSRDGVTTYNFVRALTRPYPGAFSWLDKKRWTIWQAALLPGPIAGTPGEILGPVVSPDEAACGQVVACGTGAIVLLELQADDGEVLRGRRLSEQPWTGRVWTNE